MTEAPDPDVRRGWLPGLAVGVPTGALLLEWPSLGLLIGLGFALGAVVSARRWTAIGAELISIGLTWLGLLKLADDRCRAFDAVPGQGCVGPDLTGWVVLAVTGIVVGGLLLTVEEVGSRRGRRERVERGEGAHPT